MSGPINAPINAQSGAEVVDPDSFPRGLPGRLPAGERIVWQGGPDAASLARYGFRLRLLGAYFAALVVAGALSAYSQGEAPLALMLTILRCLGLAGAGIGLVVVYSWLVRRSTIYTITDKRVVLHIGVAFPVMLNIPFSAIETAGLVVRADGSGDLALRLIPPQKFAYLILWPHARPWHFSRAEPMLRGVPDAVRVAQLLSRALAASAGVPAPLVPEGKDSLTAAAGRRATAAA